MEFELILKKIQASLDPEEEIEFQRWYEESEDHRVYFHKVERAFQKNQVIEPRSKEAWERVDKKLFAPSRKRYWWSAVAAVLVLGLLSLPYFLKQDEFQGAPALVDSPLEDMGNSGVVFIDEEGHRQTLGAQEAVQGNYYNADQTSLKITSKASIKATSPRVNTLIVPKGFQYSVELSDGTKVWLNADSKISFPSDFTDQNIRSVHLEYGEAYFEVSPSRNHAGKKFQVLSEGQRVQVLGTKFNINAYPEVETQVTTLVEGSIVVSNSDHSQVLIPGEQTYNQGDGKEMMVQKVDPLHTIAWKSGKFIFNDKSLEEIMQVLERWYDLKVNFNEEEVKKSRFSGVLYKKQELEEILEILESTNRAKFELKGSSIIIWPEK